MRSCDLAARPNKFTIACPHCHWLRGTIYPDAAAQFLVMHLQQAHQVSMPVEETEKPVKPIEPIAD